MKRVLRMSVAVGCVAVAFVSASAQPPESRRAAARHALDISTPPPAGTTLEWSDRASGRTGGKGGAGNAAPLYFQAMLMMSSLSIEEQRALEAAAHADIVGFDEPKVEQILNRLKAVFALIALAEEEDACDWGTPLRTRGMAVQVPEAGYLRLAGVALGAKARWEIFTGRRDEGAETIMTGLRLVRHVSRGPTIVQALVALSIAEVMAEQVEAYISTGGAPGMYWVLAEMGEEVVNTRGATNAERMILEYEVGSVGDIASGRVAPERAIELLSPFVFERERKGFGVAVAASAVYPAARAALVAEGLTPTQVDALPVTYVAIRYHLGRYRRLRDDLHRWTALPYWQAHEGLARAQTAVTAARAKGEGADLLFMIADVEALERNAARVDRRFAMLRTIEALRSGARDRLPSTLDELRETPAPLDPATGRRFEYRVEGDTGVLTGPALRTGLEEMEYRFRLVAGPKK